MIFKTKYNAYFKGNQKIFDPVHFLGLVAQHIPVSKVRLIRYYGLYSSKSKGKWADWEHVIKHAPEGWKEQNGVKISEDDAVPEEKCDIDSALHKKSKKNWARLIAKIYEVDPMICNKCGAEMRIIAIITNEYEVKKIMRHLLKSGKSPPGASGSV